MRALALVSLVVVAAACRTAPAPARPTMSYQDHVAEADRLEAEATRHSEAAEVARQQGPNFQCDTKPESEQTTSGGERLHGTRVCPDVNAADRRRHQKEAARLHAEAERHRGLARALVDAERAACAGLDAGVLAETPLGRHRGALRLEEQGGGVRLTLPGGTSADQVRRELGCHRARAALYAADDYMPYDPALVLAATVTVTDGGGAVTVAIRGDGPDATALVRSRARALTAAP